MSSYFLGEPQLHGQCAQHKKDLFLKAVFKHVLKPSCYHQYPFPITNSKFSSRP